MTEEELKTEMRSIVTSHELHAADIGRRLMGVAAELKANYNRFDRDELIQFDSECKNIYTATVRNITEACCRIQALVYYDTLKAKAKAAPALYKAPTAAETPNTAAKTVAKPKIEANPIASAAKKLSPAQLQQLSQMLAALQAKK